ncbi:DUF6350 family protein [Luteipulveratus sp. YIM 133132]|uniref:cell division protein PerM n=1 Tax=Luteipulveratus flavus TaxID=3031728 RepID=UPI0023B1776D|nr:DUF6350 family protein [Luteipulveratus sp. YIM 133132]MDE9367122.1 DUF6350 family protein [Luteipulveratus sp. YIM 133132]
MSLLERTRQIVPTPSTDRPPRLLLAAAGYGAVGAVALALLLVLPVMAAWFADAHSTTSWSDALSIAADGWTLAHRAPLGVPDDGASVVAPPLLLTAAAVLLARLAATSVLVQLTRRTSGLWLRVALAYVAGYALTGVVLALVGWTGPARPNPLLVVPGAVVVAVLGVLWALWRDDRRGDGIASARPARWVRERPAVLVRAFRPALVGTGVLLALGLALVLLAVVTSWSRVTQINGELDAGIIGGTILTGGQLFAAPNFAAYAATWLSGASLHLGAVTVGHASVTPGILPLVPVLGALPEAGAAPWWAPLAPLAPVAVGAFVGWYTLRGLAALASWRSKVQTAVVAATLAGVGVVAVAYAGSMGVAGSRLDYVGPSVLALPLLIGELVVGALVSTTTLHLWRTRR